MNVSGIKNDCVLCGACEAICPHSCISVNRHLELDDEKCTDCSLCYEICPAVHSLWNLGGIADSSRHYDADIGSYCSTGFAAEEKKYLSEGTSAGMTRAFLNHALECGVIDATVVVETQGFKPAVKNEVNGSIARSVYLRLPLLKVLGELDEKKKYAVVALPCQLQALDNMQRRGYYTNVILKVGLFCGMNMQHDVVDDIKSVLRLKESNIKNFDFRGGKHPGGLHIETKSGKIHAYSKHLYKFLNLLYLPRRCFYCNDFMSEFSDISFGDAWNEYLYRYDEHARWNSVVCRSEKAKQLFEKGVSKGKFKFVSARPEDLKQLFGFNIAFKKKWLAMRILAANKKYLYRDFQSGKLGMVKQIFYLPVYCAMSVLRTVAARRFFKLLYPAIFSLFSTRPRK